ncbi:class I SAM-dependent methyltransferase [Aquibaculum sediminis]|uniref:class I SAM-dependent methyltransferase n=1 Tax=Aquibaculum sediminis TaxID=3231907 RepID=UPI0034514941
MNYFILYGNRYVPRSLIKRSRVVLPEFITRRLEGDYYKDLKLGLTGKKDPRGRLEAILPLAQRAAGRSVLDLGCAEGLMLQPFLANGARFVHGVDESARRIQSARRRVGFGNCRFDVVDLNRPMVIRDRRIFCESYNIVLFLGIYQHLENHVRERSLSFALSLASEWFVIRCPRPLFEGAMRLITNQGFTIEECVSGGGNGRLAICKRVG